MNNLTGPVLTSRTVPAVIRTGIIVRGLISGETTALVSVGGAPIEAGILEPYSPVIDDLVAVAGQDSSWLILGRLQNTDEPFDSGWIPFTLNAPFTQSGGGDVPSYRKIGNIVYWRGRVGDAGGVANGVSILTVPVGFRPANVASFSYGWAVARSANAGQSSTCRVDIVSSTAVFRTFDTTVAAPTWVGLDGIHYLTD